VQDFILRAWQQKNVFYYCLLIPLSWLFAMLASLRWFGYQSGLVKTHRLSVPVVVVGNINMGGSGKTPVVVWLVNQLKAAGYQPGVISRGYGANNTKAINAMAVEESSAASVVGDEPLLIARRTGCPVWVGADRVAAGNALLNAQPACDVIVSDDGLQHYRLARDVELVVADHQTAEGQRLLPAGPMREPLSRLQTVDAIVSNGALLDGAFAMQLAGQMFYNLANPTAQVESAHFKTKKVTALAGIGKPDRFFDYLTSLGLDFERISFDDHHAFTRDDLDVACDALIMTEKDAMKCEAFAAAHHWVLPVDAQMDEALLPLILNKLTLAK